MRNVSGKLDISFVKHLVDIPFSFWIMKLLRHIRDSRQCASSTLRFRASSRINRRRLPRVSPIRAHNAQFKKKILTAPFVKHSDLISITPTTPIIIALAIARVIAHRKPLIDLHWQGAFVSCDAIRVQSGYVAKRMRGHLLPGQSHLRAVARARKMPARQIARDVRWKWLIRIGSSVIPYRVCNISLERCLNWMAVVKSCVCTTATCSLIIPNRSIVDLTLRFVSKISGKKVLSKTEFS